MNNEFCNDLSRFYDLLSRFYETVNDIVASDGEKRKEKGGLPPCDSAFAVRIFEVLPRPFSRMSQNSTTASVRDVPSSLREET